MIEERERVQIITKKLNVEFFLLVTSSIWSENRIHTMETLSKSLQIHNHFLLEKDIHSLKFTHSYPMTFGTWM